MKPTVLTEGPEAFTNFAKAMKTIVLVPRETIQKRLEQARAESEANPKRRGPKRKPKSA